MVRSGRLMAAGGGGGTIPLIVEKFFKKNIFGCTHQRDLKLGQCLDMDDMTSPSKFSEVT